MTDSKGNFILDSSGNEILSSVYLQSMKQTAPSNYNTAGVYVIDSNGNYVLDKKGNKITSQNYLESVQYVPALDAIYPTLQSQSGKAAYDIRGIPEAAVSTAPVSGLPGRPVV